MVPAVVGGDSCGGGLAGSGRGCSRADPQACEAASFASVPAEQAEASAAEAEAAEEAAVEEAAVEEVEEAEEEASAPSSPRA